MKRISLLMAAIAMAIGTNGCDRSPTEQPTAQTQATSGRLSLEIHTGAIGILARSATMTPTKIIFAFQSGPDLTILDTASLDASTQIKRDYKLAAGRNWVLSVSGMDNKGNILYSGTGSFPIGKDSTSQIAMSLDARFSSLRLRFPVKEGANRFQSQMDGRTWLDTTAGADLRQNDTIKADLDYVTASRSGVPHDFALRVSGNRGDKDTVLFALDTTLTVVSGESKGVRLVLKWVGPQPPKTGNATLAVTLGAIGQLDFEVDYRRAQGSVCRDWQNTSGTPWNETITYGLLCDERDSQAYRTVQMGSQVWMAENLNYTGPDKHLGSCPNGADSNCQFSGRLYTWTQAMAISDNYLATYWPGDATNHQGICPTGWRIPRIEEWWALQSWVAANAVSDPPNALRATNGWMDMLSGIPLSGSDQFGFHALPMQRNTPYHQWWATGNANAPDRDDIGDIFEVGAYGSSSKHSPSQVRCIQD